jgi:hypothetical protein
MLSPARYILHGVLSHQHNAFAAKADTDFVHLLRSDIVNGDDKAKGWLTGILCSANSLTLTCIPQGDPIVRVV